MSIPHRALAQDDLDIFREERAETESALAEGLDDLFELVGASNSNDPTRAVKAMMLLGQLLDNLHHLNVVDTVCHVTDTLIASTGEARTEAVAEKLTDFMVKVTTEIGEASPGSSAYSTLCRVQTAAEVSCALQYFRDGADNRDREEKAAAQAAALREALMSHLGEINISFGAGGGGISDDDDDAEIDGERHIPEALRGSLNVRSPSGGIFG